VFNPESDIRGPVPVAVAVTADRDKSGTIGIEPGRAVIIGDAEFISNTGLTGANADLLLNALNWMLERLTLLDIAPRDTTGNDLLIEARRLRHLFWIIVVAIPLTVAATGIIVWRKRSI